MDPYHHHHNSHHRRDDEPRYPPPPHVGGGPPTPPHVHPPPPPPHVEAYPPPAHHVPPPYAAADFHRPPPPPEPIHHVSHESNHHIPPIININHHHTDDQKKPEYTNNKPTFRVYSKAKTDYSLTIHMGVVILAPSNPPDPHQHWVKDETFSTRVKDEEGHPSFALINISTGQALTHSIGATYPVRLGSFRPDRLDESVLWTESKDLGDGYKAIRKVNDIKLNVDALNGDKNHGGVRNGTKIVLWEWKKGDNQRWKIVPYCKFLNLQTLPFDYFLNI